MRHGPNLRIASRTYRACVWAARWKWCMGVALLESLESCLQSPLAKKKKDVVTLQSQQERLGHENDCANSNRTCASCCRHHWIPIKRAPPFPKLILRSRCSYQHASSKIHITASDQTRISTCAFLAAEQTTPIRRNKRARGKMHVTTSDHAQAP